MPDMEQQYLPDDGDTYDIGQRIMSRDLNRTSILMTT